MIKGFAGFELDTDAWELRLDGECIRLQPRVFDLLVYLVEHQDRVISKAELLENLWPGVIVTDASLQRAVSLARTALERGGLSDAIRTHARMGYRFCLSGYGVAKAPVAGSGPMSSPGDGSLDLADETFRLKRWTEASAAYALLDRMQPLEPAALERWAAAVQCSGHLVEAITPLERAAAGYSALGDRQAAARATLALARVQLELMEPAIARGCLRRAKNLLADVALGEQHGSLAWMSARFCHFEGELTQALDHAVQAQEIGAALKNADIETMGLLYRGISLQAAGESRLGAEL